jgi:hypothetical protein
MGAINSRHSQPDVASAGTNEVIHAGDETARRLLSRRRRKRLYWRGKIAKFVPLSSAFETRVSLCHGLIIKSEDMIRPIDVRSNLMQVAPNKVRGKRPSSIPGVDQVNCPARSLKKFSNKIDTNMRGTQDVAREQGRVFGVRSLFTLVRKAH